MVTYPKFSYLVFASLIAGFSPLTAANTSSVFSPDVKAGERAWEYRLSMAPDESPIAWAQRIHYQHALNDAWRLRLIGLWADGGAGAAEFRYARFEAQWQFLENEQAGWDSAMRFELQIPENDNRPARARVGWTGKWALPAEWELRANVLTGHQFGARSQDGALLELRSQVTAPAGSSWRVGVEGFHNVGRLGRAGSFDDQELQLGPIAKTKFGKDWSVAASWLFGFSDSADDHDFRLHVIRSL